MPTSFYEVVWIFIIYAFIGWCTEVAYAALDTGKFVNRGFLNGPVCPVYGFGVLVVVLILTPLKDNFLILFAGSVVLTTVIEFITGFLLEKLFHNQWWDYSNEHFNICGYVCLKFSILWGLACTLVMDMIHPAVYKLIQIVPKIPGMILLVLFCIALIVDIIITISTILKFNRHLKLLDELGVRLKNVSNDIGENIYEGVTTVLEKGDDFKEDFEQLQAKYKEALERRSIGERRLVKAFPTMRAKRYEESLNKLRKYLEEKRKER